MNPKGGKLGTCGLEGIKGSSAEPPKVDLEFNIWLGVLNLISWGTKSQFAALGFVLDTHHNHIDSAQSQESLHLMQKALKSPHYPKKQSNPLNGFSYFLARILGKLNFDSSPLSGHTFFGALSINASLKNSIIKEQTS